MQEIIVAAIVGCAAWIVVRRYLPKSLKRNVRNVAARMSRRFGWESVAQRLEKNAEAAAACASGCGACGGCDAKDSGLSQTEFAITRDTLKRHS